MPTATSEGVQIHYELEGSGPPLLLMHGNGGSTQSCYRAGYVAALRDSHQLVLVDAPGHGESSRPHYPEPYEARRIALDMVAVLDAAGLDQVAF